MKLETFYHTTTELIPDGMEMLMDTTLPQYTIEEWRLTYMRSGNYYRHILTTTNQLKCAKV